MLKLSAWLPSLSVFYRIQEAQKQTPRACSRFSGQTRRTDHTARSPLSRPLQALPCRSFCPWWILCFRCCQHKTSTDLIAAPALQQLCRKYGCSINRLCANIPVDGNHSALTCNRWHFLAKVMRSFLAKNWSWLMQNFVLREFLRSYWHNKLKIFYFKDCRIIHF